MATSGEQARPARVLVVVGGSGARRLRRVLRAEGHIVEVLQDSVAIVERLHRDPPIDVVAIDGLTALARARTLAAARERNVWCLYLESRGASARLRAEERAAFVVAVPVDADDTQIVRTLRAVVAARRSHAVEA